MMVVDLFLVMLTCCLFFVMLTCLLFVCCHVGLFVCLLSYLFVFPSSDSEPDRSPLTFSSMAHCSQSCDLEVHRPISRENSDDVTAGHQEGDVSSLLVDEDAVHRTLELSQRLSPEAISECVHYSIIVW